MFIINNIVKIIIIIKLVLNDYCQVQLCVITDGCHATKTLDPCISTCMMKCNHNIIHDAT